MTVYVSLPEVPLTLKFEEPMNDVAAYLHGLVESGKVHRYHLDNGAMVLVNWGVILTMTLNEGARTLELSELNHGLKASIDDVAPQ